MKVFKATSYALFILILTLTAMSTTFGDPVGFCSNYAIIQLGDPPGAGGDDDNLDIESNSSVFGGVLKGNDTKASPDFKTKLSTSKVTTRWDVETEVGVGRDKTGSAVLSIGGTQNAIGTTKMNQIRSKATTASTYWASQTATNLSSDDHSDLDGGGGLTLTGSTGGANVYNSTDDFKVNSEKLTLTGGVGDYFVFNIFADQVFDINSGAEIELLGDITPEEVLFNVLGFVGGGGQDDAKVQGNSLFRGTLLALGRNVLVSQNHFDTFNSSGLIDDDGNYQAPETTSIDWQTATEGLFGQVVAGGKITWSESDIKHHGFCVPEPSLGLLLGISLVGLVGA